MLKIKTVLVMQVGSKLSKLFLPPVFLAGSSSTSDSSAKNSLGIAEGSSGPDWKKSGKSVGPI